MDIWANDSANFDFASLLLVLFFQGSDDDCAVLVTLRVRDPTFFSVNPEVEIGVLNLFCN